MLNPRFCLQLEQNVHPIALSGDWIKLVDNGSTQSSTTQIAANDQEGVAGNLLLQWKLQLMIARIHQLISPGGEEVHCQSKDVFCLRQWLEKQPVKVMCWTFYLQRSSMLVVCVVSVYDFVEIHNCIWWQVERIRYLEQIMLTDMKLQKLSDSLYGGQQLKWVGTWHN